MILKTSFKRFIFSIIALFVAITLIGCDNGSNQSEVLAEAKERILLSSEISNLTGNLALPTSVFVDGEEITITWTVSTSEFITIGEVDEEGALFALVTRPAAGEDQAEATLTATLEYNGVTTTRVWTVYVRPIPTAVTMTVANAKAATSSTVVEVVATVSYIGSSGFIVQDSTGGMYVYTQNPPGTDVKLGAVLKVTGTRVLYFSMPQITQPAIEVVTAAPATGFDYSTAPEVDMASFVAVPSTNFSQYGRMVRVTGMVVKDYKNPAGITVSAYGLTDLVNNVSVAIYNSSSQAVKNELEAKVGEYVSMVIIAQDFHSTQLVWRNWGIEGTIEDATAPELSDQQKVTNTLTNLAIAFPANMEVTGDLNLPTTNEFGVTIAWNATPAGIIASDGKFTQPDVATAVTLTATVVSGIVTENFTVVVNAVPVVVSTVVQFKAAALNTKMAVEGTVVYVTSRGVIIQDATGGLVVDIGSTPAANIKVGAVIKAVGTRDAYYGNPQVGSASVTLVTEAPTEYIFDVPTADIATIIALPTTDLANYSQIYTVTGVVVKDVMNAAGTKVSDYGIKDVNSDAIVAIYNSSTAALKAQLLEHLGETVSLVVIGYDFHSTQLVWRFYGVDGTLTLGDAPELTDAQKVEATKQALTTSFPANMEVTGDLNLINSNIYTGLTISWVVDPLGVIGTDGKYTEPAADTNVTLTATITLNQATDTFTVVVVGKAIVTSTIADAKAAEAGKTIQIQGIITGVLGNSAFIQDATGGFYIFNAATYKDLFVVGNEITIRGTRGAFNGLLQLTNATQAELVLAGQTLPTPVVLDTLFGGDLLAYQAQRVSLAGLYVKTLPTLPIGGTGGYNVVLTDGTNDITMRVDSEANLTKVVRDAINAVVNTLKVGQPLDVVGANLGWFNNPQLAITNVDQLDAKELTNAIKVAQTEAALENQFEEGMAVTGNITLPTTNQFADLAIAWAVNPAGIIGTDGTFTAPAEDTDVTLTATITAGAASAVFSVVVNAKAPTAAGALLYAMDFEDVTTNDVSYPTSPVTRTFNGKEWSVLHGYLSNTGSSADNNDRKHGDYAIRMRSRDTATPVLEMLFDLENVSHFTMYASHYAAHSGSRYSVFKSTDGGTTWVAVAENVNPKGYGVSAPVADISESFIQYNLNETGNVRIRLVVTNSTTSNQSINFDDIKFYGN